MKIYGVKYYSSKEEEDMWTTVRFIESLAKLGEWHKPWEAVVKANRDNHWLYAVEHDGSHIYY